MSSRMVCRVYFSPQGTVKKIMDMIAKQFHGIQLICDLLKTSKNEEVELSKDDLLIVGMPAFDGKFPSFCIQQLQSFRGSSTPAVIYVAYGEGGYGTTLKELKTLLEKQGFHVITAAAFVCSQMTQRSSDEEDLKKIKEFTEISKLIDQHFSENYTETLELPDDKSSPKRKFSFRPTANDACTSCGTCVSICPVQAISQKHLQKTNRWKCISCTSCIHVCPAHARGFYDRKYERARKYFTSDQIVKKSEIFY